MAYVTLKGVAHAFKYSVSKKTHIRTPLNMLISFMMLFKSKTKGKILLDPPPPQKKRRSDTNDRDMATRTFRLYQRKHMKFYFKMSSYTLALSLGVERQILGVKISTLTRRGVQLTRCACFEPVLILPSTHKKRQICASQIKTRLVCIEHYISTGSKPARRVS